MENDSNYIKIQRERDVHEYLIAHPNNAKPIVEEDKEGYFVDEWGKMYIPYNDGWRKNIWD